MGVRIEEINVENLGPITNFGCKLGALNLIYGRNEVGKTYLVEFLLNSLFSDLTDWSLRSIIGRGQVSVSGLDEEIVHFAPTSRRKLESFLENSTPGLPPKISRLLVVKGAELGMDEGIHGGINKVILKEYLSGQSTLDIIKDKIPKTIQKATIFDGAIQGDRRGDITKLQDIRRDKQLVDNLFQRLEESYSGARRKGLRGKHVSLQSEKAELLQAKRNLAYELDQSRQQLAIETAKYPQETLKVIDDDFRRYLLIKNGIAVKEKQLRGLEKESDDYQWLDIAVGEYEKRLEAARINVNPIFLIMTAIFLVVALVTGLASISIIPGVFVLLAMLSGGLYLRQLRKQANYAPSVSEVEKIEEVYQQRFNEPLTDLSEMEKKRKQLEESHYRAQTLSEQIRDERAEMENLNLRISSNLELITGEEPKEFQEVLTRVTEESEQLQREIDSIDKQLIKLDVNPADYVEEAGEVSFDRERLDEIEYELVEVDLALKNETDELNNIKQRICDQTRDPITIEWEPLIDNLRRHRDRLTEEERALTSSLVAQICLTKVLDELSEREDDLIRSRLASPTVQAPLPLITGRYNSLFLNDDDLLVRDDLGEFEVSELSTGAREQVLLALRLGIASHVLGQDKLFLILDDAFQHSDWRRREFLVDHVVSLAEKGWQVVYFTMDDHIMDLFTNRGNSRLKDDFVFEVLVEK